MSFLLRAAEETDGVLSGVFSVTLLVVMIAWAVLLLIAGWKMYVKAGQSGWTAIIPIINVFALLKIVHRPLWWWLLLLIPIVNLVVLIIVWSDLAKAFGHGLGMTLLLIFLAPIAYLVLGYGDSRYQLEEDPLFG